MPTAQLSSILGQLISHALGEQMLTKLQPGILVPNWFIFIRSTLFPSEMMILNKQQSFVTYLICMRTFTDGEGYIRRENTFASSYNSCCVFHQGNSRLHSAQFRRIDSFPVNNNLATYQCEHFIQILHNYVQVSEFTTRRDYVHFYSTTVHLISFDVFFFFLLCSYAISHFKSTSSFWFILSPFFRLSLQSSISPLSCRTNS